MAYYGVVGIHQVQVTFCHWEKHVARKTRAYSIGDFYWLTLTVRTQTPRNDLTLPMIASWELSRVSTRALMDGKLS